MSDIDRIIASEYEYFKPMLRRYAETSVKERDEWKSETIRQRQERISLEVFNMLGGTVAYGPFKGLVLNKERWWGSLDLASQCLGLYEREFLDILQNLKNDEFNRFIDVGAADGYYAIGMLTSKLVRNCVCFEQSEIGQAAIRNSWIENGAIGELEIFGQATAETFFGYPSHYFDNSLIMIDVEGFEFDLLTLTVLEHLKSSTMLIEIHNWVDDFNNQYSTFLKNASRFFNIAILPHVDRSTSKFPELRDFTDDNRALITSERRPCMMRFLKLSPK